MTNYDKIKDHIVDESVLEDAIHEAHKDDENFGQIGFEIYAYPKDSKNKREEYLSEMLYEIMAIHDISEYVVSFFDNLVPDDMREFFKLKKDVCSIGWKVNHLDRKKIGCMMLECCFTKDDEYREVALL